MCPKTNASIIFFTHYIQIYFFCGFSVENFVAAAAGNIQLAVTASKMHLLTGRSGIETLYSYHCSNGNVTVEQHFKTELCMLHMSSEREQSGNEKWPWIVDLSHPQNLSSSFRNNTLSLLVHCCALHHGGSPPNL